MAQICATYNQRPIVKAADLMHSRDAVRWPRTPEQTDLNIAIIGGGTAGAAAALFLARDGHRVVLHERVAAPAPIGAGLLIQPTGMAVLQELGLLDGILAKGGRVDQLYGTSHTGRVVMDLRYSDWRESAFGAGLHRGVLFTALWRALPAQGIEVRPGSDVTRIEDRGHRVTLHSGATVLGEYDLAVLADGTRSALRAQLGIAHRVTPYPWGALWAILPDPQFEYRGCLRQWYRRAGQMLGVMPTGTAPDSQTPVVSLFWSLRADRLEAWRARGIAAWKREVADLAPEARNLLAHLGSPEQLSWASYSDVVMRQWHHGRTVVIGDCAHAMSPQLGQGANLALIDAQALARSLRANGDPLRALADYSRSRRGHVRYYQAASRWLTPVYQSDRVLIPALRDALMNLTCKLPPVRAQMLDSLAGVKAGFAFGRYSGALVPEDYPSSEAIPKTP